MGAGKQRSAPIGRRDFLARSAGALAIAGAPWPAAAKRLGAPRLVVVSLQGGADGLALLPPHGDRNYRGARGVLALDPRDPALQALDLDGFFALHPALAPLHDYYRAGELLAIPAAGFASEPLSHAQALTKFSGWEGGPDGAGSGWLHRALAGHDGGRTPVLAIVGEDLPPLLRGPRPIANLRKLALSTPADRLADAIADLHRGEIIFADSLPGLGVGAMTGDLFVGDRQRRRNAAFRAAMAAAGSELAAGDGAKIVSIGFAGWDTHANQGGTEGRLSLAMAGLADGLVALASSCGESWDRTVVIVATEFGRTIAPNREGGTDHGIASVAFLLGGAVHGGRVLGQWPGLSADRLYRGRALMPTTDLQAVFKSVLIDHLGLSRDAVDNVVFPASAAVPPLQNLFRA